MSTLHPFQISGIRSGSLCRELFIPLLCMKQHGASMWIECSLLGCPSHCSTFKAVLIRAPFEPVLQFILVYWGADCASVRVLMEIQACFLGHCERVESGGFLALVSLYFLCSPHTLDSCRIPASALHCPSLPQAHRFMERDAEDTEEVILRLEDAM